MPDYKASVPQFASFRPKPNGNSVQQSKETSTPRSQAQNLRSTDKPHHRRSRDGESSCKPSSKDYVQETPHVISDEDTVANIQDPQIYVIDRKGDVNNLVYGSVHRWVVPKFHRYGAGSVLGAVSAWKIDREYGEERGLVLCSSRISSSNGPEKYIFSKVEKERSRIFKPPDAKALSNIVPHEADFISVQRSKPKISDIRSPQRYEDSLGDNEDTHYRSIHGKVKSLKSCQNTDIEYGDGSDSPGSEAGTDLRNVTSISDRNIELSQRVELIPHDVEAWERLIEHQDLVLRGPNDQRRITVAEISSSAEIKIHMYEKALRYAQTLKERERLLLGLMTEGAKIWDVKAQSEKWEEISRNHMESLVLWKSYLDFRQTTFSNFRFEECKEVFLHRITLLCKATSDPATNEFDSIHEQLIYVLLRYTLYLRESGFSELAIAAWQALLEFNFVAPNQLDQRQTLLRFQDFWDSEVPRFGEVGSLGWRKFASNEGEIKTPDIRIDEAELDLNEHMLKSWALSERQRHKNARHPARTLDEVVDNDPYRVILFSDIEPVLVPFPNDSAHARRMLVEALLLFCQLPPLRLSSSEISDSFLLGGIQAHTASWSVQQRGEQVPDLSSVTSFSNSISNFAISSDTMFSQKWIQGLGSWRELYKEDDGPVSYDWLHNTLRQLTGVYFQDDLAEFYLAFKWRNEPLDVKRTAKRMIKRYPSNLRLYNAYAMIEWAQGNKDVANAVFSAAIQMKTITPLAEGSLGNSQYSASIVLWKSWTWACLEEGDHITALQHLLSIPGGKPVTGIGRNAASILKAKQHLATQSDHLLLLGEIYHGSLHAECLALLDYLTTTSKADPQSIDQGNITSALSIYNAFSQTLIGNQLSGTSTHETLLQSASRLLCHHVRVGPFRPALLRYHLTRFLSLFPRNTIFISLYIWNESRLRIDNRVRSLFMTHILTPENDNLRSRLLNIRYEIDHGTIHSARSAFENSIRSPACKGSAELWRLYIMFCVQTPRFESTAKDIWIRALRACP